MKLNYFILIIVIALVSGMEKSYSQKGIDKKLWKAYEKNDVTEISTLIEEGADVNSTNDEGNTILHLVVKSRKMDLATLLIDNGADPNVRNKEGNSPLHIAVNNNRVEMVKMLIEKGADVNLEGKHKSLPTQECTPLHIAVIESSMTKLALARLISQDDTNPGIPRRKERSADSDRIIAILLEAGANPNVKDGDGSTPLMLASKLQNAEGVRILLKAGADYDVWDRYGRSALDWAVDNEDEEIAEILREAGAKSEK
jgi:cytohesin